MYLGRLVIRDVTIAVMVDEFMSIFIKEKGGLNELLLNLLV